MISIKEINRDLRIYKDNTIVIWGAGIYGERVQTHIKEQGIEIYAYCDNNSEKWGTCYNGIKVISPQQLSELNKDESIIKDKLIVQIANSPYSDNYEVTTQAISEQINKLGISNILTMQQVMEVIYFYNMIENLGKTEAEGEELLVDNSLNSDYLTRLRFLDWGYKKSIVQKPLKSFILNVVDHCNLNCQCCDHFSCIADEYFLSVEDADKDLRRMSELLDGTLEELKVEGGEALLHPELTSILELCSKYFPNTKIQLLTNGILLPKQTEAFWQCCKDSNVSLLVTKYPLTFDYQGAENLAKEKNVEYRYYSGSSTIKVTYKPDLDKEAKQIPKISFYNCHQANDCIFLMQGKLYTCPVIPNIKYFNKKFGMDFKVHSVDFIDIYDATSGEQLAEHVARPVPFCRYCMTTGRTQQIPWAVTKGVSSEWLPE